MSIDKNEEIQIPVMYNAKYFGNDLGFETDSEGKLWLQKLDASIVFAQKNKSIKIPVKNVSNIGITKTSSDADLLQIEFQEDGKKKNLVLDTTNKLDFIRIVQKEQELEKTKEPENQVGIKKSNSQIDLSNLTWEDAEHLVGELFRKKGYAVKVTQKTGDFGIDVEAKNSTEFIGIQVKHWNNDVGFDDCAKTLGVSHQYNKAIIISTKSGFTPQAWKFQKENQYRLELWDSERFRKELADVGISSSSIQALNKPHGTLPKYNNSTIKEVPVDDLSMKTKFGLFIVAAIIAIILALWIS